MDPDFQNTLYILGPNPNLLEAKLCPMNYEVKIDVKIYEIYSAQSNKLKMIIHNLRV